VILAELVAKTGEAAKSGPIGLAVILILCVVCYFLFKSMSKHLRNVRERFPVDGQPEQPAVEQTGTPRETGDVAGDQPGSEPPAG
jgi:hypothetical protein